MDNNLLNSIFALNSGDFRAEIRRILAFLQARFGFDLWMFTRVVGEEWIVVSSEDTGYGISDGDTFHWADSFCSQMVIGNGPQIAPDSDQVPSFKSAKIGEKIQIRAYIGVPVNQPNGELFGTLCAIDPNPKSTSLVDELPLINMFGSLIGRLIATEIQLQTLEQKALEARLASEYDALTGIKNRLAWKQYIELEEARAITLATPVAVIILDLDDLKEINDSLGHQAGDKLLSNFSQILVGTVKSRGNVFRIGGDEFAILISNAHQSMVRQLFLEIRMMLDRARIQASAGIGFRSSTQNIEEAWEQADREMYQDKARSKEKRAA